MGLCLLESCLYINEACRRNRSAYLSFIFLFTLFHLPHSVCPRVSIIFHRLTQFLVAMETVLACPTSNGKMKELRKKGASETGNKKQMKMKKMNKKQWIQVTKGENYSVETNQPLMPSGSQYWVKTSVPKDTFCAAGRHRWHLAKWYYICMVWERIAKNRALKLK